MIRSSSSGAVAAITAAVFAVLSPQVGQAQTADEIIDALRLPEGGVETEVGLTRGLNIEVAGQQAEPAPSPSIDLAIGFAFNSADLLPEARASLDELGKALQSDALSAFRFQIVGHTDAVGSEAFNRDLSEQRAATVSRYLADRWGVARDRVQVEGKGESDLANPLDPGAAENRRVEIQNLGAL